mmetsp:Transcript_86523/g.222884  ORF Transcript_86523/g.222884 Transcript_86523/m.222884 type:complete len:522 (-) Transcript_86523:52-1617(-)
MGAGASAEAEDTTSTDGAAVGKSSSGGTAEEEVGALEKAGAESPKAVEVHEPSAVPAPADEKRQPRGRGNKIHGLWRPVRGVSPTGGPAQGHHAQESWQEDVEEPSDNQAAEGLDEEAVPRPLSCEPDIPSLDLAGRDSGKLVEALAACGVVYVRVITGESSKSSRGCCGPRTCGNGALTCRPQYLRWRNLLADAHRPRTCFYAQPAITARQLRLSRREDLQRTLQGSGKQHRSDDRTMFGLSDSALRAKSIEWGDLQWVLDDYRELKTAMSELIKRELAPFCKDEKGTSTLGVKVRSGKESWSQTALRHCVYPDGGSCSQHTDYGVVTLQCSTTPGLEGYFRSAWRPVQPPPGYGVLFAGDMLERLTNGHVRAMLHRVYLDEADSAGAEQACGRPIMRQSHILFLQPDRDSVVGPLKPFLSSDGANLEPVRYGDWHTNKVSLAFGKDLLKRPPPSWHAPFRGHRTAVSASCAPRSVPTNWHKHGGHGGSVWVPRAPPMDPPPPPPLKGGAYPVTEVIQFQ